MYLLSSWCRNAATAGSRAGGRMGRMLLVTWKGKKRGEVRSAEEFSADSPWQGVGRDKGKGGYGGKEKAIIKRLFLLLMCLTHLLNCRDSRVLTKSKQQVENQRGYSPDGAWYPSQAEPLRAVTSVRCATQWLCCSLSFWTGLPLGFILWSGRVSHKCHLSGCFGSPSLGPFSLQSVKGHFDSKEKQPGAFRGRIMLQPQQLCQFRGLS